MDSGPTSNREDEQRPPRQIGGNRPFKKFSDKPFNRDRDDKPRRSDRRSFNREDRPIRDDSQSYDSFNKPSYNRDRKDRPPFNRDRGDRPSFNKDRGDRPSFNRDRGDRPSFNRDRGDRPSFNRSDRGDRGDRPSFNRDRGDRPSFNRGDRDDRPRQSGHRPPERQNSYDSNEEVMKYYGVYSCKELVKKREDDIERVFLTEELVPTFKLLLSKLSKLSKGYKVVESEELVKITDSTHHEGICIIAKKVEPISLNSALLEIKSADKIAYLDGVENPHNIGAILRTAAHFGITHLLMHDAKPLAASGYRVAREGAENVKLISVEDPVKDLGLLKKCGFTLIATAPKDGISLKEIEIPKQSVLILGGESNGVSEEIAELADHLVTISGSGSVESLNVSSAFSVMAYHASS
ncbi:MAG: TrmH family RNA methyltransferase [Rhabdochlamydiaceae bacterium]|nr:TrmH family RNA methyltransferase [Candidatus Amphrikana amoebophyrae]